MNAPFHTMPNPVRPVAGNTYVDAALLEAVDGMRPGWIALRDGALAGGGQEPQARVRYALLHPEVGIALLDVVPGSTILNAPDRLRRSLEAADFQGRFGGCPPIAYLCMPSRTLPELEWLLTREFAALPRPALAGGDAWVGAARRVLAARPLLPAPRPAAAEQEGRPSLAPGWGAAEARAPSRSGLGFPVFCGSVALLLGCGAFVLQRLEPSSEAPPAARAAAEGAAPDARSGPGLTARPGPALPPPQGPDPPPRSAAQALARLMAGTAGAGDGGSPAGLDGPASAAPATADGPLPFPVPAALPAVDADQAADASAATDAAGPGTGAIGATPNGNAPAGAPGSGSTAADERAQAAVATMPPAPGTRPPGTLARADIFTEPGQEAASGARNTADLAAAPPEAASHALAPPAPPSDTAEDAREQAPDTAAGPDGERSAGGLDASAETAGAAEGVAGGPGTLAQVAEVDGRAERQEAQAPLSPSSIAARPFSTALRESPGPTAPAPLRPTQRSDLDAELPGAPVAGTAAAAPTGTADAQETAHAADERTASGMGTAAPAVSDPPSARQAERDRSHESAEPGPNVAGLPAVAGVTASGAPPGVPAGSTASVVGTVAAYPAAGARAAERSAEAEAAPASEPAGARLGQGQPSLAVAGFGSAERNSPESVASAPGAPAARLADSVDGAGPAPAPARETAAPPQATASAMPPPRPLVHRPPSGAPAREAPPRAARGAVEADVPSPSSRCRTIVLMAQLGEAPSQADRSFLRDRCGARR